MRIIIKFIIIMGILFSSVSGIWGNNIDISNIWESYTLINLNNNYEMHYIDVDVSPTIYLNIINNEPYQQNIVLCIKSDEGTLWRSPLLSIPPKSNNNTISAKLKFKECGSHKIHIDILDKDGNIVISKMATVYVADPIDVEYISCNEAYVNKSNPNIEVCNSPWFKIGLKNNKYSQSDYIVKIWIAVVSNNYNKDANKNNNDTGILYYGKNSSKLIYIPKNCKSEVYFKIPPIIQRNSDSIKIQVHTEVMGVHDYTDGPAKTEINGKGLNIVYCRNTSCKIFVYPISLLNVEVITKLNKTTANILKKYYKRSNIDDEELRNMIEHYTYYNNNYNVIPRAYMKNDPYLAIIKLTLRNRYDKNIHGAVIVKNNLGTFTKNISLNNFETRDIYIPIYLNYEKNGKIKIVIYSNNYIYITSKNINIVPKRIPIVKIKSITYSYNNKSFNITNDYVNVLVGKTYLLNVKLVNNYNKTLSGKIVLNDNLKKGVVNYPSTISFKLKSNGENTLVIPITFYTGARGEVQFTVKTDDALAKYSKFIHFNAQNIKAKLYYNGTFSPKIAIVNNNSIFNHYPVAGCYNNFVVRLKNPLDEKIECLTWIEVVKGDNYVKNTSKMVVNIPPKGFKTINFKIKFNEGFEGYILLYAIPTTYHKYNNISNIAPIVTKSIKVVAPLSINLNYYTCNTSKNNSQIHIEIISNSTEVFPVSIHYNYWTELIKNNVSIFKSVKKHAIICPLEIKNIYIKLGNLGEGNYTLNFYVEIPNFIKENNKYRPMILKRSKNIIIAKKGKMVNNNVVLNNDNVDSYKIYKLNNASKTKNNTKNIFKNIYQIIKNSIYKLYS
ncbi:hypothetical protein, partial [Methanothermococcus sp.]|uniref:hypothetical protein n=1 Tax=Methanothermococcus sp. TaxID=2614238 RepID=UPI0025F40208